MLNHKYVVPLLLAGFVATASHGRAAVGGSPFYEFKVVARVGSVVQGVGGEFPLSFIEPEVSINDNGRTVFTGHVRRPTGIASAVVTEEPATGTLYWLNNLAFSGDSPNPNPFASLTFLEPQIINDGTVVVSELVNPDVRIYNSYQAGTFDGDQNSPPWVTVRYILRDNDNFFFTDEAQGSISEDGVVSLVVTKREGLNSFVGTHWLDITPVPTEPLDRLRLTKLQLEGAPDQFFGIAYPAAGLGGATVVNTNGLEFGGAVVYVDTALQQTPLASTASGWQRLGTKPGITSDGKVVAFVGRDANGVEGIFIQIFDPRLPQSAPVPVITTSSVIGMDENENPIHFSSFDFANRTPIIRHDSTNDGEVLGDSLILSFIATPSSESIVNPSPDAGGRPLLFSSGRGIWTIKVDIQEALGSLREFVANTAGPFPVIQEGDQIDGLPVDRLHLWDGLGLGIRELSGAVRRTANQHPTSRDHLLAFTAHTANGMNVIKAAHLDTDGDGLLDHWERPGSDGGIDMDRDGTPDLRLAQMGATDTHKDLFLEIDWLAPRTTGYPGEWFNDPQPGALEALTNMFHTAPVFNPDGMTGIVLHIDAGHGIDATGMPFSQNMRFGATLDGGQHVTSSLGGLSLRPDIIGFPIGKTVLDPHIIYPKFEGGALVDHFHNLRTRFFGLREKSARELAFRYCILGDFADQLEPFRGIFDSFEVDTATKTAIRGFLPGYNRAHDAGRLPRKQRQKLYIRTGPAHGEVRRCSLMSYDLAIGTFILRIDGPELANLPSPNDSFSLLANETGVSEAYTRSNTIGRSVVLNLPLENMGTNYNLHTLPGNDFFVGLGGLVRGPFSLLGNPLYQWKTIAHELGHTLGLMHSGNSPSCPWGGDKHWSLMSYSHLNRQYASAPAKVGGDCYDFIQRLCRFGDTDPIEDGCQAQISDHTFTAPKFFQPPWNGLVETYSDGSDQTQFNEWGYIRLETWSAPWKLGNTFNAITYGEIQIVEENQLEIDPDIDAEAPVILLNTPVPPTSVPLGGTLLVAGRAIEDRGLVGITVSLDVNGDGLIEGEAEVIHPSLGVSNTFSLVFSGFTAPVGVRQLRIEAEDLSGNIGFLNPNIMVGGTVPDTRPHTIFPRKPELPADLRPIVRLGDWFEVEVTAFDFAFGRYVPTNSGTVMFTFDINGDGMTNGPGEVVVARAAISNIFHVFFPNLSGPQGNRTLRIVSTDEWLNQSVPVLITVNVIEPDGAPPSVSFVTPVENLNLSNNGLLAVDVIANDNAGVAGVVATFDVDGDGATEVFNLVADLGEHFRATLGVDPFFNRGVVGPGGPRQLTVTATDQSGNTTNISRIVTVAAGPPPTAIITSPPEGSPVRTNGTLTVEVDTANATVVTIFFDRDGNGQTNGPGEAVLATSLVGGSYRAVFNGISGPSGSRLITAVAASSSLSTATALRRVTITDGLVHFETVPGQTVAQSSTFTVQLQLVAEADASSVMVRFDSNGDGDTDDPGETVQPAAQAGGRGLVSFSNISGPLGPRFVRGEALTLGGQIGPVAVPVLVTDGGTYDGSRSEKLAAVPFGPELTTSPSLSLFGSGPQGFTVASNRLFFLATSRVTGRELWRTDGTKRGTFLLQDIRPGRDSANIFAPQSGANSDIKFSAAYHGKLFFSAFDGVRNFFGTQYGGYGRELWSSDGTTAGTILFKDIRPRGFSIDSSGQYESSEPNLLTVFNDKLFFVSQDGTLNSDTSPHGWELWSSDGTAGGTSLFKDVNPGTAPGVGFNNLLVVGNTLYFTDYFNTQLWKSDGTPAGTVLVKDPAPAGFLSNFTGARGLIFFVSATQGVVGKQIWRSDGTAAGTFIVRAFPHTSAVTLQMSGAFPDCLLLGIDDGVHGVELWKSDGTTEGTVLVKDISSGGISSVPVGFTAYDGLVYFSANDGVHGRELWRTDGTEAGTRMVINLAPGENLPLHVDIYPLSDSVPESLTVFNGKLYFTADSGEGVLGRELWRTDGTAAGTELVKDLVPGIQLPEPGLLINGLPNSSNPTNFQVFDGRLYFMAWDPIYRHELWTSDGTTAGTYRLRNLSHAPGSAITPLPGGVVFAAGDLMNGTELWASSVAGTTVLTNIGTGGSSSSVTALITIGAQGYFAVATPDNNNLYVTDGTKQNTRLLASIPPAIQVATLGNWMLFSGANESGRELWRTDGTVAGTLLVKDINPGAGDSSPTNFFLFQGQLYFQASDSVSGSELWRSDGTPGGTVRVADINPGPASSNPNGWSALGSLLIFWANDGTHGREPWILDGSTGATQLLKDISGGPANSDRVDGFGDPGTVADPRAVLNGVLYFRAHDGVNGLEMWRSDGTPNGTKMVSRLGYNASGSKPGQYTILGNLVMFTVDFNALGGAGLWKTDGTSNGTVRVRQFFQNTASGGYLPATTPQSLLAMNGLLFFQASDNYGWELWRSDGTTNGTFLLKDIMPGVNSSEISGMTEFNNELYFTADDGAHGRELWKSDGTSTGTQLIEDLLPGPGSSDPQFLTANGGILHYFANDGGDDLSLRRLKSGSPVLTIAMVGTQVVVSWRLPATGFILEETSTLSLTDSWTPVSLPYATNATHISVAVSKPIDHKFYRLRSP